MQSLKAAVQRHEDSAFYKVDLLQLHFLSTIYRASSELRIILKRSLQTTMPEIDGERILLAGQGLPHGLFPRRFQGLERSPLMHIRRRGVYDLSFSIHSAVQSPCST